MKSLMLKFSLSFFLILALDSQALAETFDPSWSLDFTVEPIATHIAGEPVANLTNPGSDLELTHIATINCQQDVLSWQQCQQIERSGGLLEMYVDGNQDGKYERWSIAVGKTKAGKYAKLLLIQDTLTEQVLQVLHIESDVPGFSALYFHQGEVLWGMCLNCDVLADVVWDQNKYQVRWQRNLSDQWQGDVMLGVR